MLQLLTECDGIPLLMQLCTCWPTGSINHMTKISIDIVQYYCTSGITTQELR